MSRCASACLARLEVRVLDDADEVPERVAHRRDADASADVLKPGVHLRANPLKLRQRLLGVLDAPVCERAARAGLARRRVRVEPQLEAADVEADGVRLVEVRVDAERLAVPGFAAGEIVDLENDGAQTEEHDYFT